MSLNDFRIGYFLSTRELKRTSIATNSLIIFVMTLTFLNLVTLRGILIGIPEGATNAYREKYSADIIISPLSDEKYILRSQEVLKIVSQSPDIKAYTTRTLLGANITSNFKARLGDSGKPDSVNATLAGINPIDEDLVTNISNNIIKGDYLEPKDHSSILIGANLLTQYSSVQGVGEETLEDVDIGSKLLIKLNGTVKEFKVAGILKSKVSQVERRIFMTDDGLRSIIDRNENQIDEIAIRIPENTTIQAAKLNLSKQGVSKYAKIQSFDESQPQFLNDIKVTFAVLGDLVGTVGLLVASITIFIVIFVNAITKRKYIGILKGIGITESAIEISYVFQSVFYAFIGSAIGVIILYGFLVPFFTKNPIPFPFADGILLATYTDTALRLVVLWIATIIAGYIPARIVVKQNTLNAILGR